MTITPHPPLTFPTLPFAKLAPSAFLTAHLSQPSAPLRPSGRAPSQTRALTIHTSSLTHAYGSAVVRLGDTSAVCGVRGEILNVSDVADWTPSKATSEADDDDAEEDLDSVQIQERARKRRKLEKEDISRLNLLVPNVELATGCSPGNLPGGPPSTQAQVLSQRLLALLHTADIIPLERLRIWSDPPSASTAAANTAADEEMAEAEEEGLGKKEVKAFWVLYIDILFLSLSGPPLDAAWLAMLAALRDTKLPRGAWDLERERVVCDPNAGALRGLDLRDLPVALTFGVHEEDGGSAVRKGERRKWVLADLDGFEEGLCREMVTIVMGKGGRLFRIEKEGGGGVGGKEIRGLVDGAERWRRECVGILGP